jgi:hypothetical protein
MQPRKLKDHNELRLTAEQLDEMLKALILYHDGVQGAVHGVVTNARKKFSDAKIRAVAGFGGYDKEGTLILTDPEFDMVLDALLDASFDYDESSAKRLYSWLRLDDYSTERITKELVRRGYDVALVRRSTPRTYVGPSRNFHLGPKRNIAASSGRLTSSYHETVGSYICA